MNRKYTLFLLILLSCGLLFAQTALSCYDIQYNPEGGGDSPYLDQIVTVQGIVSGVTYYSGSGYNNYGFFISDPTGGPWSGLFIYNQTYQLYQ